MKPNENTEALCECGHIHYQTALGDYVAYCGDDDCDCRKFKPMAVEAQSVDVPTLLREHGEMQAALRALCGQFKSEQGWAMFSGDILPLKAALALLGEDSSMFTQPAALTSGKDGDE